MRWVSGRDDKESLADSLAGARWGVGDMVQSHWLTNQQAGEWERWYRVTGLLAASSVEQFNVMFRTSSRSSIVFKEFVHFYWSIHNHVTRHFMRTILFLRILLLDKRWTEKPSG